MKTSLPRTFALLLLSLCLMQPAVGQEGDSQVPPAAVRVGQSDRRMVQDHWDVVGRLQQVRQSVVAAEVSGRVIEMEVEAGDAVEGGQTVLARIDDVWAKINLAAAEAELVAARENEHEAEARLARSRIDLEKLRELLRTGSARQREYDEAQATADADQARLNAAAARISAAQAALDRARREVERLVIRAPFDGVVVRKMMEVGEWAQPGAAVVEIVSRGRIDAVIDVPERLIQHVRIGAEMSVFIEALQQAVPGQVVAIVPQGMNPSRTFPVKIRLDDADGKLMSGMSVQARVPTTQPFEAVTVPRDAVYQTARGPIVWAAVDGKATSIPVEVLFGVDDRYVIKSENNSPPLLVENMAVVVEGGERIFFPGQPLSIVEESAAQK